MPCRAELPSKDARNVCVLVVANCTSPKIPAATRNDAYLRTAAAIVNAGGGATIRPAQGLQAG